MNVLNLATLEKMLPLIREREMLLSQLAEITRRLEGLQTGSPVAAKKTSSHAKASIRRGRGKSQRLVLSALRTAGAKGLSIKEIAKKTKIHLPTLRVWIYTAGKNLGLRKVSPGRFAFPS